MLSQATARAKINTTFANDAAALGILCQWHWPSGRNNAIALGNLFDGTVVAVGRYLMTPTFETDYITTLDPFRLSQAVVCNLCTC